MALWPYALRTVAQVKDLWQLQGTARDTLLGDCINQASRMIEAAWGRHLVSRGALTEYHVRDASVPLGHELFLNEFPVVSVTSVHEDANAVYPASTLLVVTTDYIVSLPSGKLTRVSSSLPTSWVTGWRAVKVVYVAGYKATDGTPAAAQDVPEDMLSVFDELLAWTWRWRTDGSVGLTTVNDATGSRSFIGAPFITPGMQARLNAAGALPVSLSMRTGERDS